MAQSEGAHDEINSSDCELGEAPVNPFARAGQASIQRMLESAVEDRAATKKAAKHLQQAASSTDTDYRNALWFQRFQGFREGTLHVK